MDHCVWWQWGSFFRRSFITFLKFRRLLRPQQFRKVQMTPDGLIHNIWVSSKTYFPYGKIKRNPSFQLKVWFAHGLQMPEGAAFIWANAGTAVPHMSCFALKFVLYPLWRCSGNLVRCHSPKWTRSWMGFGPKATGEGGVSPNASFGHILMELILNCLAIMHN